MLEKLPDHIFKLERDQAYELTGRALEEGREPLEIIGAAQAGMAMVGDKFESGEYFLSELMLSAVIFKNLVEMVNPHLAAQEDSTRQSKGKVVMVTPQGDIHDLGKDILVTLLRARGFEVEDLGVDVSPRQIAEKVMEFKPDILGISCLLTTAFLSMKQTADILAELGLRDKLKLMIGGGVTNESTRDYVGADFQTTNAMDGVNYCLKTVEG